MRDEAFALQLLAMAERWAGAANATLRDRKNFSATVFSVTRRPEERALLAAAVELYDLVGASVPIYFLVEKYIKPRDGRQEAALAQLPALAEQLQAMLKQAGMA